MTSAARVRFSRPSEAGSNLLPMRPAFPVVGAVSTMEITSDDLEELFSLAPQSFLRRMPGRETFAWPGREGHIVKRFQGGARRDWWYERLRGRTPRSPARMEAENLDALARDGIDVPRVVGWAESDSWSCGAQARSAMVMELVPHTEDLRGRLARSSSAEVERLLDPLADLVAKLHRAGWYHRDLYLQHVVLRSGSEELVLLDVGRARKERSPRRRWFVKDLAALLHSTPRSVSREHKERFLERWLALTAFPGSHKDWTRQVRSKAERLAAHAPRHTDLDGPREEPG